MGNTAGAQGAETITVTIWHNVATDPQGRHLGMLDGFQSGNPMTKVFTYEIPPATLRLGIEAVAEQAFAMFNDAARTPKGSALGAAYYARELRSLSVGDMVQVGEAAVTCESAGWQPVNAGDFRPARVTLHGTNPL